MSFLSDLYGYTMGTLREIWMLISNANAYAVSFSFLLFIAVLYFTDKKFSKKRSIVFIVICSLYATFLVTVTILGRLPVHSSSIDNLFLTYIKCYYGDSGAKYDIIYNIALFVPVGALSIRYNKRFIYNIGFLILLPTVIESIQLITYRGVFELTDIVNNAIGGVIGYSLALLLFAFAKAIKEYTASRKDSLIGRERRAE